MLPLVGSSSVRPGLELAGGLGRLDHRLRDAVLDRAGRVLALELRVELDARLRREARQLDERRVADQVEQAGGEAARAAGHGRQQDHRRALADRRLELLERADVLAVDVDVRVLQLSRRARGSAAVEVVEELARRCRRAGRPRARRRSRCAAWVGCGPSSCVRSRACAELDVVDVLGDRRVLAADRAGRVRAERDLA